MENDAMHTAATARAKYDVATETWLTKNTGIFNDGAVPFTEDWPSRGVILKGLLFPLPFWEHPTKDEDFMTDLCSLKNRLRNLNEPAYMDRPLSISDWMVSPAGKQLEGMARRGVWPTPTASYWKINMVGGGLAAAAGVSTAVATRHLWETTKADSESLSWMDLLMGEPAHSDTLREKHESNVALADSLGELPNPVWVEGLMGFPPGWTEAPL